MDAKSAFLDNCEDTRRADSNRVARVRVTWDLISSLLCFPPGTKIESVRMPTSGPLETVELVVSSSTLLPVPEGDSIPLTNPGYSRWTVDEDGEPLTEPAPRIVFEGWGVRDGR